MSSKTGSDSNPLMAALAQAGRNERLRALLFEALREEEGRAASPEAFRADVRWPLIQGLLHDVETHRIVLENGLLFDVSPDSRIEKAFLLSRSARPDHVWEPQTTRLLAALASEAFEVIVGGAYIGDQVLPMARATAGRIHAFEPMARPYRRLLHHLQLNGIENVQPRQAALWSKSGIELRLQGDPGLASAVPADIAATGVAERALSASIDDYVSAEQIGPVGLIMLDVEGGEEQALLGGRAVIERDSPHIVFEIHRMFVDWTNGLERTDIAAFLVSRGYRLFAIRDFHDNYPMGGAPIEVVPFATVHLDGPPHGFNVLATRDAGLMSRLSLRVIDGVSPKLLHGRDPVLHSPHSWTAEPA